MDYGYSMILFIFRHLKSIVIFYQLKELVSHQFPVAVLVQNAKHKSCKLMYFIDIHNRFTCMYLYSNIRGYVYFPYSCLLLVCLICTVLLVHLSISPSS